MKRVPWDELIFTRSRTFLKQDPKIKGFVGFDTETLHGKVKLIADSSGYTAFNPTWDDCLAFLTRNDIKGYHYLWFNIHYDFQAMLRCLDNVQVVKHLLKGEEMIYGDYKIKYILRRFLIITKGMLGNDRKRVKFFHSDISRFFHSNLDNTTYQLLGRHKDDSVEPELIGKYQWYWDDYQKEITFYCIQDAKDTRDIGIALQQAFLDGGIIPPTRYVSPASIAKAHFRRRCDITPREIIPLRVQKPFYLSYGGGHFEISRRGSFDYLWLADLVSAYWSTMLYLPSFLFGEWRQTSEFIPHAKVAVYKVSLFQHSYWNPLFVYNMHDAVFYPSGLIQKWVCQPEMALIREMPHQIVDGWWYDENNQEYHPYEEEFLRLFEIKRNTPKNDPVYVATKLTGNSFYGCSFERIMKEAGAETGMLFNPVVAAMFCSDCRAKCYEVLQQHGDKVVAVHTDSIIATEPLDILGHNLNIGDWGLEAEGAGLVIGSGQYEVGYKEGHRGVSYKSANGAYIQGGNQNWRSILQGSQFIPFVCVASTRVSSGLQTLLQGLPIDAINRFGIHRTILNLKGDHKRHWYGQPTCGQDLLENIYDSVPVRGNMNFAGKIIQIEDLMVRGE